MTTEWKLVPVVPTPEMLRAAQDAWLNDPLRRSSTLYSAMLDAAPAAPVQQAEPVAWVDVHDRDEGPYEFHGRKSLDAGAHDLYLHPPAAELQRLVEAAEHLIERCNTSDDCQYGTLSTKYVRDILRAALEGVKP